MKALFKHRFLAQALRAEIFALRGEGPEAAEVTEAALTLEYVYKLWIALLADHFANDPMKTVKGLALKLVTDQIPQLVAALETNNPYLFKTYANIFFKRCLPLIGNNVLQACHDAFRRPGGYQAYVDMAACYLDLVTRPADECLLDAGMVLHAVCHSHPSIPDQQPLLYICESVSGDGISAQVKALGVDNASAQTVIWNPEQRLWILRSQLRECEILRMSGLIPITLKQSSSDAAYVPMTSTYKPYAAAAAWIQLATQQQFVYRDSDGTWLYFRKTEELSSALQENERLVQLVVDPGDDYAKLVKCVFVTMNQYRRTNPQNLLLKLIYDPDADSKLVIYLPLNRVQEFALFLRAALRRGGFKTGVNAGIAPNVAVELVGPLVEGLVPID